MSIIEKIKQRSDGQKKIFSLFFALILTVVIVICWFSLTDKKMDTEIADNEPNTLSSISPLKMIKDEFSNAFSDFNDKISDPGPEGTSTASTTIQVEILSDDISTSTEDSVDPIIEE